MPTIARGLMQTQGFWPSFFMVHTSSLLVTIHIKLCSPCSMQNLLLPAGSSHKTSLLAWSYAVSTARCPYLRIYWARGNIMVANCENMAQDCEARFRIDLGPAPVWSLLLELQVSGSQLVNYLRLPCMFGLHLGHGEFIG